ncbi:class II D-tagatose-bisphosphate aldolase, non-catalytic subunit [Erysipelothrix urinaevulpis]|uniref:class II D-tagatose-bisphosphate aldolase, non-catalytic subunit n=1 Tax=Erysipelothrix urinaevulpis TaxID=2683717 RepID=UPI00135BC982|nr:class II D-tagatose-bisphosphate aldolase, non-catalytic subunit [Erysipelothrix urinaevulpis]
MMENQLKKLNNKKAIGIYSACTANSTVIEAVLERSKKDNSVAVIEATANQVNQFGGYTGMKPLDFRNFVYELADKVDFPHDKIILGGDHLGPLTWVNLDEDEAMKNAEQLVYDYVYAGFTKIHLDTSMKVANDDKNSKLSDEIIANRTVRLAQSCKKAFSDLQKENIDAIPPVYIIGSEVPIPGGSQEIEEMVVTSVDDLDTTYNVFKTKFSEANLDDMFDDIIAIVVQPGVEFGDENIDFYNREKAKELVDHLKSNYPNIVFEGHSTDYQTPMLLKNMVEDGINILKVGPALTLAYREALFALSHIEDNLVKDSSKFIDVLENTMIESPENWQKYYHGTEEEQARKRKFSFSDRARYYLPQPAVSEAISKLESNLSNQEIPLNLLSQYLPIQYRNVKEGKVKNNVNELIKDYINVYLDDYVFATNIKELSL